MLRSFLGSATGAAVAAILLAIPLAWWTLVINSHQRELAVVLLAFDFWLVLLVILLPVALIVHAVRLSLGWPATAVTSFITACVGAFSLLWFVRIESAHQPFSINPHLTANGAGALLAIAAASVLIWTAAFRRRWITLTVLVLVSSAALELLAVAQTPSRRRDGAISRVSAYLARTPGDPVQPAGDRVLFIGVDGMDWRSVATLIDAGKLPTVERLLRSGRYYQMDNKGLRESAEIWTAIYTRLMPPESGIDNFLYWHFRGDNQPVIALPRFGFHSVLAIDRFLSSLTGIGLWSSELVGNTNMNGMPIWTAMSGAGRRVLVFEPMNGRVPEKVNGIFVIPRPAYHVAFSPKGRLDYIVPRILSVAAESEVRDEQRRCKFATDLIHQEHFDEVIYYASFLDGVQHVEWTSICPGCERRADFASTSIGAAYIEADRTIARLIDAFGQPATVVLVSDHGWDYRDYEHFHSPMGMFVVSPSKRPGYGGVIPVWEIAPAVLALANVAPDQRAARVFIDDRSPATEDRERLHSLGYIGR